MRLVSLSVMLRLAVCNVRVEIRTFQTSLHADPTGDALEETVTAWSRSLVILLSFDLHCVSQAVR
jgi:hypothetical protein